MTHKIPFSLVALSGLLALSSGCGSNLCDRSSKSATGKTGSCGGQTFDALGPKCSAAEASCQGGDQKVLEEMVACFENLPTCSGGDEAAWLAAKDFCYAKASGLSEGCKTALFEGGVVPGVDAGVDAGADLGPQPDLDGGGALDLVATADETDIALAWTKQQNGFVTSWQLHSKSGLDIPYPVVSVTDPNASFYTYSALGSNASRGFFVIGASPDGGTVMGTPFGGVVDAGSSACSVNSDCPINKGCDVVSGQCKTLVCSSSAQCPVGYACDTITTFTCLRTTGIDGGSAVVDAGQTQSESPKPLLSELVTATTGPLTVGERSVSEFAADQDPDVVGIDSARQAVVLQQFGQIWLHVTEDRGRTWRTKAIDPLGVSPHVTYNKTSKQLFVCYQAGQAVRVRTTADLGKTWEPTIAELLQPDPGDGGIAIPTTDCDIAPWQNGGALLSVLEGDRISTYPLTTGLAVGQKDVAFVNEPNDGGTAVVFNVQQPVIATLPDEFIVHVAFQGTRNQSGGTADKDVYGVYRDPTRTAGLFSQRMRISGGAVGAQGQVLEQSNVQLALEPGTGRAVAAFQSEEAATAGTYLTVYLALFNKFGTSSTYTWATGSDLSVFAKGSAATYIVMTDRPPSGTNWDAMSPSLAFTGTGKGLLTFASAIIGSPMNPYVVGFSFDATSPINNSKGWFLPPAVKVSTTPVVDLGNTPKRRGPVISGDQQISSYITFIEGVGAGAQIPNKPIILFRPR